MNISLNKYSGFCFELNFELNHFWAKFNEKMNFQNVSNRAMSMWMVSTIKSMWRMSMSMTKKMTKRTCESSD